MRQDFVELDLSDQRVRRYVAGIRPFRRGAPRIEVEMLEDKVIGHNYGHGGSGITMSWGSAAEIVDLLAPWLSQEAPVAVLGAGIMGLCTASLLLDRGHAVTIYARDFPPHTTSNVAGGLWAPTHVGCGNDQAEQERHQRILRRSWQTFRDLEGRRFGIEPIPMFEADDARDRLDHMPEGLTDKPRRLDRLPFSGRQPAGQVSQTLLVETPRFLDQLLAQIQQRGGRTRSVDLGGPNDLRALPETVLVNCLGLGAGKIAHDENVLGIRGQLVLLDPAPRTFFLDHALGYTISRRDILILGGTFEEGVCDNRPVDHDCQRILHNHRTLFAES